MNPILLDREVREGFRDLVRGTFGISSPVFHGMIEAFLAREGSFLKGPWITADMPFRPTDDAGEAFPEVPLGFVPHRHQALAFNRLRGDAPKSTLVATGTGSGKTESYLWPILDMCRQRKHEPGVKAILIYPMNALATDQARRIARAIHATPSLAGVRAGMYADAEPDDPKDMMGEEDVITRRDALRRAPPDILLTNYKMLDYLLLRGGDRELWSRNAPETLRFLVVDEIHTFDGAQGADLALLIRRLKARLGTPARHLACVGSSATMGSGEEAEAKLRSYAEDVFGERFAEDSVIREDRLAPHEVFTAMPDYDHLPDAGVLRTALIEAQEMEQAAAAERVARAVWSDLPLGENPDDIAWRRDIARRLRDTEIAKRAFEAIRQEGPAAPMSAVAARFRDSSSRFREALDEADAETMIAAIISLAAWARDDRSARVQAFLGLRCQTWARELVRMVASLPCALGKGKRAIPELLHSDDLGPEMAERTLPLVRCDHCFSAGHLGRLPAKGSSLQAEPKTIYDEWFNGSTRLRIVYHEALEKSVGAQAIKVVPVRINAQTLEFSAATNPDPSTDPVGAQVSAWLYDPTTDKGRIDRTCPHCGAQDALFILGLRAARLSASLAGTLFASRFHEEDPAAKPRMLMFSDSVQDAAHRAAVTESRNAKANQTRAIWRAIDATPNRTLSLEEIAQDVPAATLREIGAPTFIARYIAGDMTWRDAYRKLVDGGVSSDPTLADDVALRFGWEAFSDLTWQSRRANSLVGSRLAAILFAPEALQNAADRLQGALRRDISVAVVADIDEARRLLLGALQELAARGAVDHPYIAAAQATAEAKGPNWFGARGALGVGKRDVLPLFYAKGRRISGAPRLATLRHIQQGYDSVASSASGNWFRAWVLKFMARSGTLYSADDFSVVMRAMFGACEAEDLIGRHPAKGNSGPDAWLLRSRSVHATSDIVSLCCTACARKAGAPRLQVEINMPCARPGCRGEMAPDADIEGFDHLHRLCTHGRAHRVVAREHTGLLAADARRRLETGFIKGEEAWHPNVISATSTLEMGIDIGDLSSLLLCSVPPRPANYVQRAGRTGRRDGNSLNVTAVNGRPHDLQFWEEPRAMLAGEITPPGVHLQAPAVLKRQAAAYTLDRFVAEAHGTVDYGQVKTVLSDLEGDGRRSFLKDWLDLLATQGAGLVEDFIAILPEKSAALPRLTDALRTYVVSSGEGGLRDHVVTALRVAARDKQRLRDQQSEIDRRTRALKVTKPAPDNLDDQIGELKTERSMISRSIRDMIDNRKMLEFLTDAGVLPNYAFPEVGVKLKTFVTKAGADRKSGLSPEDIRSFEYVRPPSSALSELAPFQSFYADGREISIDRLDIETDEVHPWRFCAACTYAEPETSAERRSACPRCGDAQWRDVSGSGDVVELRSVLAFTNEAKAAIKESDERVSRQYDRTILPVYKPEHIEIAMATDGASPPFGYEFISTCEMRDVNFGEKSAASSGRSIGGEERRSFPFRICGLCGQAQKPPIDENDPGQHTRRCKAADGKTSRSDWEKKIFLMRRWSTEALRIVMPVAGEAKHDEIKSFSAAIDLGMRKYFGGAVDHVRSTVVSETVHGAPMKSLYLYDAVPGGSGYLRQMAEDTDSLRAMFSMAKDALEDCPCSLVAALAESRTDGCHRCVRSWRAHFGPGEPRRSLALSLVGGVLANWDRLTPSTGSMDRALAGPLGDSALETRFLDLLRTTFAGDDGADPFQKQVLKDARTAWQLTVRDDKGLDIFWNLETQVQIDKRFPGLPMKRVDFLLTPQEATGAKPIVLELDGWEHHASTIEQDLSDRLRMIRSGEVRVWTLTWDDLEKKPLSADGRALIPLDRSAGAVSDLAGRLAGASASESKDWRDMLRWLTSDASGSPAAEALFTLLRRPRFELDIAAGTICTALSGSPQPNARPSALSEPAAEFLHGPRPASGFRSGDLRLMLSTAHAKPAGQFAPDRVRAVIWADIPEMFDVTDAPPRSKETWRGMWNALNLLQALPLHVDRPHGHGLPPPEETKDGADGAWGMLADYDEDLESLLTALQSNGASAPDMVGADVMNNGRVCGQVELGWSAHRVGLTFETFYADGWTLITVDLDNLDAFAIAVLAADILPLLKIETTA
jgi:DEAD/DEAH box helicase domain-containing protein